MNNDPRSKWLQYLLTLSVSMPALAAAAPATPADPLQISQGAAAAVEKLSTGAGRPGGEVNRPVGWPRAWAETWPNTWPRAWAEAIPFAQNAPAAVDGAASYEDLLSEVKLG